MGGFQTQVLTDQIKFCFILKLPGFSVEETKRMGELVWGSKQCVLKAFLWSSDSQCWGQS